MSEQQHDSKSLEEAYDTNRLWWDEVTEAHFNSTFYDVAGFRDGRNTLPQYVRDEVGDVSGRRLLHLQCHFGMDTLSWARLGARVTGVDFGRKAIAKARELAHTVGLEAAFVEANIYELGDRFDARFDIVFTSHGALAWLHDTAQWGRTVARALAPGGLFYISDFHPFLDAIQDERPIATDRDLFVGYPYFNSGEPLVSGLDGADYASNIHSGRATSEWFHPLSDVTGALLEAGLALESFREQDFCVYRAREGMVQGDDGFWRMPDGVTPIPLMFSLKARRPA